MDRRRFRTAMPVVTLLALVLSGSGALRATSDDALVDPATCRPPLTPAATGTTTTTTASPITTTVPTTTTAAAPTTTAVPTTTTAAAPTTTAVPTTTTTVPGLATLTLAFEEIATVRAPSALTSRDGSPLLYVAERAGLVRSIDPATGTVSDPLLDLTDDLSTTGERGLLGLAFSNDGTRLYASFNPADGNSRVDEWTMDGDAVAPASRRTVITVEQPAATNHKGGDLAIGPDDMLWWALGDGGGQGDEFGNGQNLDTLLAGIVRVDPTGCAEDGHRIPADNPFVSGGGAPAKWASGLRNPWRFSFDRATGDLWIADVGQDEWEEINLLPAPERDAGANFGWPLREGTHEYQGAMPDGAVDPVHEYAHGPVAGCSITGGYVYRGAAIPQLRGTYLYSDFCGSTLRGIRLTADGVDAHDFGARLRGNGLATFGEGPDGEIYALSLFSGAVGRVVLG